MKVKFKDLECGVTLVSVITQNGTLISQVYVAGAKSNTDALSEACARAWKFLKPTGAPFYYEFKWRKLP